MSVLSCIMTVCISVLTCVLCVGVHACVKGLIFYIHVCTGRVHSSIVVGSVSGEGQSNLLKWLKGFHWAR